MGNEYRSKVFKSGNSVALRLPKALGIAEGTEMCVREEAGKFEFEPVSSESRIDLTTIWGSCPDLKPFTSEERELDPSPRSWDDPAWSGHTPGDDA